MNLKSEFIEPKGTPMTIELLEKYINRHKQTIPHYMKLLKAYTNDYCIFHEPKKPDFKPDNRLAVNYAKYITDTMNGFFIGIPIKITHENEKISNYLNALDQYNNQDDNNAELSKICSIFGHGYELLYSDEQSQIGITYLTPMDCFIIYDDSILHRPMFAVRWYVDENNVLQGSWSDSNYVQYFSNEGGFHWVDEPKAHYFGDIPIIEYKDNEERLGIFESVLPLIDEYNKALSEKANDVDYYADAYLKILGARLDEDTLKDLRNNRIINIAGDDAEKIVVEFMQKPEADSTQEHLIDRLERLIFQISMVANISEENFGNASGVALKYRLQAMNNLRKTKERKFTAGLNKRYKMIAHYPGSPLKEDDWLNIKYKFTPNIPSNLLEESQIAGNLSGITSQKTQLSVLSCVDNVDDEIKQLDEQNDKAAYNTAFVTERTVNNDLLGAAAKSADEST